MIQNIFDNPFVQCTARDMNYEEVLEYWCDPFNSYKISEQELFNSKTPIFIEGIRGSGKTMILKYLSYFCQKEDALKQNLDLFSYFKKKNGIGVYIRYKEDFVNMFSSLVCSEDLKDQLFTFYFELLVSREITHIVVDLFKSSKLTRESQSNAIIQRISAFFSVPFSNLEEIYDYFNVQLFELDIWVKNSRYNENSEEDLIRKIKPEIINNLFSIIKNEIVEFNDVLFLIIIDEYENAKGYQKNINTYIKKVDESHNFTFRVGMRIEGISTYETKLGEEILQIDRDFLLKQLVFSNHNVYKKFLRMVSQKRLESNNLYSTYNINNIEQILGVKEDVVYEAKLVIKNSSYNSTKHFELLKNDLDTDDYKEAIAKLKYPENPLIEMLNILWVLRGTSIEETYKQMNQYLNDDYNDKSKYKRDYIDKYKYQLVFILANIHKQKQKLKKLYYSFNTFAFLSSGSVNDFISLCRNTFYQLDNNYFNNIEEQPLIAPELQTNGASKTAQEQLGKIKANDENGSQMYTFIMNIGNWFSIFHKDPSAKYPETNQFAFENEAIIDSRHSLRQCLKSMLKWGAIIQKQRIQSISIGRRKGSVYYLNHIFAPLFNISYRIRGGYNPVLSTELFETMLFNSMEIKEINKLFKKKASNKPVNKKKASKEPVNKNFDKSPQQLSIFGEEYINE